jgi:hypothetical protein
MDPEKISSSIEQAHTAALYNTLIKTQHEILLSELAKMEKLN